MSLYQENELLLEEPSSQAWVVMQNRLNSGCTKQQLQRYAEALIPWLGKYHIIKKIRSDGSAKEAKELNAMMKETTSKYVITEGLTLILASNSNLQKYIDTLKPNMRELWRHILLNGYVTNDKAMEILGIKSNLFDTNHSYYYYSSVNAWNKREYGWWITSHLRSLKMEYGYRGYEDYITVNNAIRGIFFPLFFPELQQPDLSLDALPAAAPSTAPAAGNSAPGGSPAGAASPWRTIDFETESLSAFNLFCSLYKQGELPMKKKGVTNADMKRANKKLALREFFPDDHNEFHQYLRAYNYLGVLAINEHLKSAYKAKKVLSYADTLLDLFKNFDKFDSYLPTLLYPHIKGLRQNQTQWGHHDKLCKYMIQWLKDHPDNWVSIVEIYMRIVELGSNGESNIYTALVYNPSEEQNSAEIINLYSSDTIVASSYACEFGFTGLKSFGFILASLGMAEIALHSSPISSPAGPLSAPISSPAGPLSAPGGFPAGLPLKTPFDTLHYIRLTPLGRYALGVTKEYAPPEIKQEAYFELDPERLIIRSLQDPNPYEQLLRDTAVPISRGRFQTSALSFLTNCHSREDVEGKINIFRQFIASELPPLWQKFFLSLLQHCHPLTEDKTSYRHYTIQPDNGDLIQLITTDPVLRQIVIRAEDYRILVKNEDIRKFETQLKKHGYLL